MNFGKCKIFQTDNGTELNLDKNDKDFINGINNSEIQINNNLNKIFKIYLILLNFRHNHLLIFFKISKFQKKYYVPKVWKNL